MDILKGVAPSYGLGALTSKEVTLPGQRLWKLRAANSLFPLLCDIHSNIG